MAKVIRGRLCGLHGMTVFTAEQLHDRARHFALRSKLASRGPGWQADDERWLNRWSRKIERVADRKDKARDHKESQRKPR